MWELETLHFCGCVGKESSLKKGVTMRRKRLLRCYGPHWWWVQPLTLSAAAFPASWIFPGNWTSSSAAFSFAPAVQHRSPWLFLLPGLPWYRVTRRTRLRRFRLLWRWTEWARRSWVWREFSAIVPSLFTSWPGATPASRAQVPVPGPKIKDSSGTWPFNDQCFRVSGWGGDCFPLSDPSSDPPCGLSSYVWWRLPSRGSHPPQHWPQCCPRQQEEPRNGTTETWWRNPCNATQSTSSAATTTTAAAAAAAAVSRGWHSAYECHMYGDMSITQC